MVPAGPDLLNDEKVAVVVATVACQFESMFRFLGIGSLLLSLLLVSPPARSEDAAPPAPSLAQPKKAFRIAPTFQVAPFSPLGTTAVAGVGLHTAYEFIVTPSFFVGLQLAARYFPAPTWLAQLGYGVTLRHAFLPPESLFRPYVAYGLLLQMVWVNGRKGFGLAHDTHLAFGVDSRWLGVPLFLTLAYDFSRLRYFENAEESLDRFEVQLGWEYRW